MLGPLGYLDPGTGSLFLQLLLGGVAGFLVVLKLSWRRILSAIGIGRPGSEPEPEARTDKERQAEIEG